MQRRHWAEIADKSWCPSWLRSAMVGYLQAVQEVTRPYADAARPLSELLEDSKSTSVVDLCSGSGGPWPGLHQQLETALGKKVDVTLTDLKPEPSAVNRFAGVPGFVYLREAVLAEMVPKELKGVRTMFTGLHHFSPTDIAEIFEDAQRNGVAFAAFEATHRSLRGLLVTLLIPLMVLLIMPRVRPRRPVPLVLTYVPPIVPAAIWWDGVISTLRTYRAAEIREIIKSIEIPEYRWEVSEERVKGSPLPMLQVVGRPLPSGVHGSASDPGRIGGRNGA